MRASDVFQHHLGSNPTLLWRFSRERCWKDEYSGDAGPPFLFFSCESSGVHFRAISYLVGASHKKETGVKLLKEHDTLSLEAASEENEDGSRGDRRPIIEWFRDDQCVSNNE